MVMLEIRDLSSAILWDVASFCFRHPRRHENYSPGDEERYKEAWEKKRAYLDRMLKRGARAKIAYLKGKPVGFIEYYPIEICNLEVVGRDIMAIWCLDVREKGRGIGSRLIDACVEDSRNLGRKGVVVTCWDPIWMPRKIFEKSGFAEVGKAVGTGTVLFKEFEKAEAPVWVGRGATYETQPVKDKVVVDLFHSDRCPIHWRNTALLKSIIADFGDAVIFNEYNVDERDGMLKHSIQYSAYLNGQTIIAGPVANEEELRSKIKAEAEGIRTKRQ
jgi:ribosomal protein S18 acetylase RimI-like enzyme